MKAHRLWMMMIKECWQMIRDPAVIRMMIGVPIIQLFIFGFALNTNPKNLSAIVINSSPSAYTQRIVSALAQTKYFSLQEMSDEHKAEDAFYRGDALFLIFFPPHFSEDLIRGEHPQILVEFDATDSVASAHALSAMQVVRSQVLVNLKQKFHYLQSREPFDLVVHARYNAELSTTSFIVPGLLGLTITASLLMVVAMSVTKERERGTMEGLLATPLRPIEVLIGKMTPYILIGYVQIIVLTAAAYLLKVPIRGHLWVLFLVSFPFIVSNLSIGVLFSVRANNQLEAVSASTFFFLPSILLSGFMFPFQGMPMWAQVIGQVLPMTHYVHITRDIMLKGHGLIEILPNLWPIVLFTAIVLLVAVKAYRSTLD